MRIERLLKYWIVAGLDKYCLHHPWWYLGFTVCGMALLSYHLDRRWHTGWWVESGHED